MAHDPHFLVDLSIGRGALELLRKYRCPPTPTIRQFAVPTLTAMTESAFNPHAVTMRCRISLVSGTTVASGMVMTLRTARWMPVLAGNCH
jgi:hypothetical protein